MSETEVYWENPQELTADLPAHEQSIFEKHPNRFKSFLIARWALIFLFFSAIWIIPFLTNAPKWVSFSVLGLWILALSVSLFELLKSYQIRGYSLRRHDISYRSGFLFHRVTTVPFNRIQHSEISHGPIMRLFKLQSLKVYTAGGSSSDLSIPCLPPDEAKQLRDRIAKRTEEDE